MVERVGIGGIDKSVVPVSETMKKGRSAKLENGAVPSFTETLEKVQDKSRLRISAHARERMENRQIKLEESDLQEISAAVEKAGSKGARSSLLLYGDIALVASVVNRTIITAIDDVEAREHIFTGIDSAIIVK
ncbi:MAG: flagellar protein [Firmicutes bacterium]|jgi:flagellar operon protein|nr:flagellar protein [Bacillota bacterium]